MAKAADITKDEAERVAIEALGFLAEDPERLGRFLAETGLDPGSLRAAIGSPETLASVLEHLLSDESALLVFAAARNIAPERIAPLHHCLATGEIPRPSREQTSWTRRK